MRDTLFALIARVIPTRRAGSRAIAEAAPATVLVYVGLDLIGDGLTKLPFVRALRAAYPDARITWLAGKGRTVYASKLKPVVAGLIDEVIEDAGIGRGWREALARPLPGRSFDLILDTQRRVPTTVALRRIRHRRFVSGCANYLFSDVRPAGAPLGRYRRPAALVDQMLELISLERGRPVGPEEWSGDIALPDAAVAEAARLLPDAARAVAMAPGAGKRIKCWPLESFISLGRRLAGRGLVPVYLLGPDETEWMDRLRAAVPQARFPLAEPDAALSLEPLLTLALARRCMACIANDSGGGHIMAASGTPMISLFGPTSPKKFAPRTTRLTVIDANSFGSSDMSAIPVEAVDAAIAEIEAA